MKRKTLVWMLYLLGCVPMSAQSADTYALAAESGRIEALSFGNSTMIVGGLRYRVAMDAKVEIGGSYGAFTLLQTGMRIYYEYEVISPTQRRIVLIRELPAAVTLEET